MTHDKNNLINSSTSRNYGIDALRILSMIMIVLLHVLGHGGIVKGASSINYWVACYLGIIARCAVDCYALISGYVGISSKYKISNLAALWCRVAFYSIIITIIFKCIFPDTIGKRALISAFFPVISSQYWYFSSYVILFLFIPILNIALNNLSQKTIKFILVSVFIFTSFLYPFAKILSDYTFSLNSGYSAWWLILLYLLGGYIRKYGLFHKIKTKRPLTFLLFYFISVTVTWLSKLLIRKLSMHLWGEIRYDNILTSYQSVTILACAVFLLLALENIRFNLPFIKIISFLSPLMFSVYLIHDNEQIRTHFISDRFTWIASLPLYQMIPVIFGIVIGIFLICTLIDLIRHYLFKIFRLKEKLNRFENMIRQKLSVNNLSRK